MLTSGDSQESPSPSASYPAWGMVQVPTWPFPLAAEDEALLVRK